MVIMLRSKGLHRLLNQALVRIDLFGLSGKLRLIVGDDVESDVGAKWEGAIVVARDERRIHENFVARHRIVDFDFRSDRSA